MKGPRVLFDSQIFDAQRYGGVSRYFYEIFRRFPSSGLLRVPGFACTRNAYLLQDDTLHLKAPYVNAGQDLVSRGLRVLHRNLPRARKDAYLRGHALDALEFDLFHPTYYDPYFLDRLRGRPFVLTVYDMIHEILPEYFASHDPVPAWKRQLTAAASRILAISETTKQDLIRILNLPAEKIVVTHLAASVENADGASMRQGILFVGKRGGYKNFDRMLRACAPILKRYRDLDLTCVGGGPFGAGEQKNISSLGLGGRLHQIDVSEDELPAYYDRALMFVFPSLYEGFGLPLLESFARGCPVAAARAGSLPEVAGNAAVYFDPGSEQEMTEALLSVLDSSARRSELTEKGRARLREFSWDNTFQLTQETYRSVVRSGPI